MTNFENKKQSPEHTWLAPVTRLPTAELTGDVELSEEWFSSEPQLHDFSEKDPAESSE